MKIDFALEFDHYLEYHSYRLRKRESKGPGIIAFVGFGLLALGYILLKHGCEGVICGIVLFAGLAATAASVPVAMAASLLRRKDLKRREGMLRTEFDRLHGGPREFEADESGWRFSFKQAQNIRTWDGLSWFRDERQTFIVADEHVVYMLPKSALKPEELEQLRDLCLRALASPAEIFSVPLDTTVSDVLSAAFAHNWRKRLSAMLTVYGVGLASMAFLWLVVTDAWPFLRFPSAIFLLLLLPCIEGLYYVWQFQTGTWRARFQTASILPDALRLRNGSLQTTTGMFKLTRSRVLEVQETGRVFVIYGISDLFYMLPKSGIQPDKMDEIRKLLYSWGT
jgi:hypothetical protein